MSGASRTTLIDGLHRKAQEALRQNLASDEEVRVVVYGPSKAAMIGTDRRLFIFKTGVSAGATFGAKFTSFDYRNVSGVQLHTGAMTGSAVVDVAGAAPVGSSYWGNKNNDPWKAQNAIPITRPYDRPRQEVARLRELIAAWHDRSSPSAAVSAPSAAPIQLSIPDQIRQLGELRDQGLVTPEEFEAKKTDMLSRL